jgi:hypothetical protein
MGYGTVSGSGSRSGSGTFFTDRLTVTNSTISNNQGDGLLPDTTLPGSSVAQFLAMVALGSMLVEYSRTRFVNSTITGNSAPKGE